MAMDPYSAGALALQGAGAIAGAVTGAKAAKSQAKLSNQQENILSLRRKQMEQFAPFQQQVLLDLARRAGINVPMGQPTLYNKDERQKAAKQLARGASSQQKGQPGLGMASTQPVQPAGLGLFGAPATQPQQPMGGADILGQRNPFLSGEEGLRLNAFEEAIARRQRQQENLLGSALERRGLGGSATLGAGLAGIGQAAQRQYGDFARQLALEGPREQERRLMQLLGILPGGTPEALALAGQYGGLAGQYGQQAALGGQGLGQFGQNLGLFGMMQQQRAQPDQLDMLAAQIAPTQPITSSPMDWFNQLNRGVDPNTLWGSLIQRPNPFGVSGR